MYSHSQLYNMTKANIKERNFIKILKFCKCFILQRLITSGKSMTLGGTKSRVHASNVLICHDVLFTRD